MKNKLLFIGYIWIPLIAFSQWVQQGASINGETADNLSGWSVCLSSNGSTIAIGAPHNNAGGNENGQVRVYSFDGTSWVQLGNDIEGISEESHFGYALSLNNNGTVLAVGAPESDINEDNSGAVFVYSFDGVSWVPLGNHIYGEAAQDQFGYALGLSGNGNRVVVGAPFNMANGAGAGHIRIYELQETNWVQLGNDVNGAGPGNYYGTTVSINDDGSRVAVGAPTNSENGMASGHVRIFAFDGSDWGRVGEDINGEGINSYFGRAVSLDRQGNRVAVGGGATVIGDGGEVYGYAGVYDYDSGAWVRLGAYISSPIPNNQFGASIGLSGDGNTIIVGAPYSSNASELLLGRVQLYTFNGIEWVQYMEDIDGEGSFDQWGHAVSISDSGNILAVGAPFNTNENGDNSGHVRVYSNTILSLEENDFGDTSIQLFPNPTTGIATLTLAESAAVSVNINDIQGRLLYKYQYPFTKDKIIFNTNSWKKGLYLVTLKTESKQIVLKMIVR